MKELFRKAFSSPSKWLLYLLAFMSALAGFRFIPVFMTYYREADTVGEVPEHFGGLLVLGMFAALCGVMWFFVFVGEWLLRLGKWVRRNPSRQAEAKLLIVFAHLFPFLALGLWSWTL